VPTITDTAICIRCWDFSETSQTVSLFSREHGIVRGLAKGAKREKGPFSGGLDVLTRGEVVAIVKPGRDLATITAWHLQDMFRVLRQNLPANRAGLYMADLVHHMFLEHDAHIAAFDGFVAALEALNDPQRIDESLLRFQWMLLEETGYQPELNHDAQTGAALPSDAPTLAFSATSGGVVVDQPDSSIGDRWRVRRETIETLRQLQSAKGESREGDLESVRRANRLLAAYFRHIIGSEPPSMRWAFGEL
jgi:DNA repair protein RecO (recombination protein O)